MIRLLIRLIVSMFVLSLTMGCDKDKKEEEKPGAAIQRTEPERVVKKRKKRKPKVDARSQSAGNPHAKPIPGVPDFLQLNAVKENKKRVAVASLDALRVTKQASAAVKKSADSEASPGYVMAMVLEDASPIRAAATLRGVRMAYYIDRDDAVPHTLGATKVTQDAESAAAGSPSNGSDVGIWLARGAQVALAKGARLPTSSATPTKAAAPGAAPAGSVTPGASAMARPPAAPAAPPVRITYDQHGIELEGFVPGNMVGLVFEEGSFSVPKDKLDLALGSKDAPSDKDAKTNEGSAKPPASAAPAEAKAAPGAEKNADDEAIGTVAISVLDAPGGKPIASAKLRDDGRRYRFVVAGGATKDDHRLVTFHYPDLLLRGWVKAADVREADKRERPGEIKRRRPKRAKGERHARGKRSKRDEQPSFAKSTLLYDKPDGAVVGAVIRKKQRLNATQGPNGWTRVEYSPAKGTSLELYAKGEPRNKKRRKK